MIPVEIISFEQAEKLGLTNRPGEDEGACCIAEGKHGEKGEIVEKFHVKKGEHHLVLMHPKRIKHLKDQGEYENYLDQFVTILGEKKEDFFKNNNLKLKEKI